ncbi:MAG: nickel pincer cofactor biosynthesis protein LarB [Clostridia bacterium]
MDKKNLDRLLKSVKEGKMEIEEASKILKSLPFEDLGFAKVDHHRELRSGFPEVIYCPGKTPAHTAEIFAKLADKSSRVLATRATMEHFLAVKERVSDVSYNELGKLIIYREELEITGHGKIAVISAGTADLPVAEEAAETAALMGNEVVRLYDVGVAGVHRLINNLSVLEEATVLIVVAGMEGALPSVVGGLVYKPMVAVPTSVGYGANLNGVSALLAMLTSCASGITVVNIDNGFGAGYAASMINHVGRK